MSDNPYLARMSRQRIGETGRKAEKATARSMGARLTPASGAATSKGDMTFGDFLAEHKATVGQSMAVKREWLAKIEREALATGKQPAVILSFLWPSGDLHSVGRWVLVPERTFRELAPGP